MTQRRRSPETIIPLIVLLLAGLIIGGAVLFAKFQQRKLQRTIDEVVPAEAAATGDGVVYGVLLYSPTCPHCQKVITEDWPQLRSEFGDQLELLFINTTTGSGQALSDAIYEYYAIPADSRVVPTMMIGDAVFVGDEEIPTMGRETIRAGIAAGGVPLPPVPGLIEAYNEASQME